MTQTRSKEAGGPLASSRLNLPEYTALMAMMSAMVAFSIDSMLPAMGEIASTLTPGAPNRVQLILSAFLFGMGLGTVFAGPIADAIGRRTTILGGISIYCLGAWLAWMAPTLELVVAARVLQGLGVAGPRVASLAVTRDLFQGRQMARVISLMMSIFVIVPAAAPLIGSWVMAWSGWRGLFLSFIAFAFAVGGWYALRQPETLQLDHQRPLRLSEIWQGLRVVTSVRRVVLAIGALVMAFAMLFLVIATTQQVFEQSFGRQASFPAWFAVISLCSAIGALINARIVVILGMRRVLALAFGAQMAAAGLLLLYAVTYPGSDRLFLAYLIWLWTVFMTTGFTIGNLNALALEPVGHRAGLASSIISACGTIGAVFITAPAGILFDGTPVVPAVTVCICGGAGLLLMRRIEETQPGTEDAVPA